MTNIPIDVGEPNRLLQLFGLAEEDLVEFRPFGELMASRVDELVADFYEWLEPRPEFPRFFSDKATLDRVKRLQKDYWIEFLRGRIDDDLVQRRRDVGNLHARIDLPIDLYIAAMNFALGWLTDQLYEQQYSTQQFISILTALRNLIHLDMTIVIDTFRRRSEQIIAEQNRSILELSTPVLKLWDDILLLPVIGFIDSARATQITENLLKAIVETQSRVAILDVTGLPDIDTSVASGLLKAVAATRMLGAEVILTGISPEAAQTLITAGIDLGAIRTRGSLSSGFAEAFRMMGRQVTTTESSQQR